MTAMIDLPPRLYLIGSRGTGKTTVGRLLAKRLAWAFGDADELVTAEAACSIAQIFAAEGEAGFRRRETRVLAALSQCDHHVIATGGGIVLSPDNRLTLRTTGLCVWLTAPPRALWERIQGDPSTAKQRPPLTSLPGPDEVRQVLELREPLYREVAHLTVATEAASPDEVVSAILSACSIS